MSENSTGYGMSPEPNQNPVQDIRAAGEDASPDAQQPAPETSPLPDESTRT